LRKSHARRLTTSPALELTARLPSGLSRPRQISVCRYSLFIRLCRRLARQSSGPITVPASGGVTFANFTAGQFSPPFQANQTWSAPVQANFSEPGLQALARKYSVIFGGQNITGTVTAPIAGQSYRLQLIIHDGDGANTSASYRGTSNITVGSDTLSNFNDFTALGSYSNNTGVYVNYTFVSTGAPLTALIAKPAGPGAFILNAYDIIQLPEPASAGMLILAGIAAMSRTALRRRAATRVA
jgi:hypothetical protein